MAQPACTTTCCDPAASRVRLALFILGNCIMSAVGLSAVPSLLQMTDRVMAFVFHGLHTKHCSVAQLVIILHTQLTLFTSLFVVILFPLLHGRACPEVSLRFLHLVIDLPCLWLAIALQRLCEEANTLFQKRETAPEGLSKCDYRC